MGACRSAWLGMLLAGALVVGGVAACGDDGDGTTPGSIDSSRSETTPGGPPDGWIDPGTSPAEGPEATATPTPTDCSVASLEIIFWRGWDSPVGTQTETLAVDLDSVRLTADGIFAVFDYYDTTGRLPDGTLLGDCDQGYWQLVAELDDDFSCSEKKSRYMPRYYAALVELGVCDT